MKRRTFLGAVIAATSQSARAGRPDSPKPSARRPNLVFVFADQLRAQATGYAGDPNVRTPHLDRLAAESVNFTHAVSGCPVCTPYRASLMTGQYPLTHGLFLNDLPLREGPVTFGEALRDAGYDTAYIGKWHLDGHGRSSFIPRERRRGFDFWRVMECTHDYNASGYYADDPVLRHWEGYDAIAQTREAQRYLDQHGRERPFALFLSWGPPHNPYETAPKEYRDQVRPGDLALRTNVPRACAERARTDLAGYYAHILALDSCVGALLETIERCGIADDTLFVFTSDHGDMLYSQGLQRKQKPFDESIRVPFLLRYPRKLGRNGRETAWLIDAPDVMPTLLGLCGITPPKTVEGRDLARKVLRASEPDDDAALLTCVAPFGEWTRAQGGREYRGVRTQRYTYVRDLHGPWLLFDNQADPCQQTNLCGVSEHEGLQRRLDAMLNKMLRARKDAFEPGDTYIQRFGYRVDETGTIPVRP